MILRNYTHTTIVPIITDYSDNIYNIFQCIMSIIIVCWILVGSLKFVNNEWVLGNSDKGNWKIQIYPNTHNYSALKTSPYVSLVVHTYPYKYPWHIIEFNSINIIKVCEVLLNTCFLLPVAHLDSVNKSWNVNMLLLSKTIYVSPTLQILPKIFKHVLAPPPPYKSWTCPSRNITKIYSVYK